MMLLLGILITMVSIALASYLYEKRQRSSRASKGNDPGNGSDVGSDVGFADKAHHDFEAGDDAD